MQQSSNLRHGGRIVIEQLKIHGCERVFLVPGESFLAVLDGLVDVPQIETVVCRQEGGAAIMAEAYGKLTGKPGICMVTRGPGATNASAGVHIAQQDSTPMILIIGQVSRQMIDREAFQEVDFRKMFEPLAKWVGQIDQVERIPEYLSHAYHIATSGRPGPVVLALPEDVQSSLAEVEDGKTYVNVEARTAPEDVAAFRSMLAAAAKPLVIVGGSPWTRTTTDNLIRFAERNKVAIATSFRCQDYIPNTHPNYVGDVGIGIDPKLAEMVSESDLIALIGSRMGEITSSGYTLLKSPCPEQKLIHVYPSPDELGRVYRPDLAINASQPSFIAALAKMEPISNIDNSARIATEHANYINFSTPLDTPGDVKMAQVINQLCDALPEEAIITNGAGNYAAFLHRFYQYRSYRTQLAPTSGSMGYGLPAAISAKLQYPERDVVCVAGDGCFMMHGQEFATAVQYGANIITLIVNNGMFGTIRMHQERNYPTRISGTNLRNPDFAAYARAFGGYGETVTRTEDFLGAFERARNSRQPAIIELKVDPEALTPLRTLSQVRAG
ncbi:thiamine pyrophosphate-binding protein [Geopsychrobacter electrodiphilus]|uniref:thiamine pyrophosphate-binding protein n=1 Tax=Geopsychrobacter electrodiphilus TaxID=225196 RepID=UPI0003727CB5|nr:thiamine pyrophosphate-binding protein [Geopsychrobacter electrodiphilus]